MGFRFELLASAGLLTILLTGCATPGHGGGVLRASVGEHVPPDVQPAWIYEIDGQPVAHTRGQFIVSAGKHEVRVYPRVGAPDHLISVPSRKYPSYGDESLIIEVEPGRVYYLGARIEATKPNNAGYFLAWKPVVYRASDGRAVQTASR